MPDAILTAPEKRFSRWVNLWVIQAVIFLVLVFVFFAPGFEFGNQYDDSYITYRYAFNLAEGHGLTFNPGEKVNSASSLAYTAILALLYRMGLRDLETTASMFGISCALILLAVVIRLLLDRDLGGGTVFLLTTPLFLSGTVAAWSTSGMETVFFTMLVAMFYLLYARSRDTAALFVLGVVLLTRPEGVLLLAAVVTAEILGERGWKYQAGYGSLIFLFLAYLLFNRIYYLQFLPHSFEFKRLFQYYSLPPAQILQSLTRFYLRHFAVVTVLAALFTAASISVLIKGPVSGFLRTGSGHKRPSDPDMRLRAAISVYLVISAVSFVLGPYSDLHRYTIHVLPIVVFAAGIFLEGKVATLPRTVLILGSLILLVQASINLVRTDQVFDSWREHQAARREIGRWVQVNVPAGDGVLSSDLGAISFFARDRRFVDSLGLTTRGILDPVKRGDWRGAVHWLERQDIRWVADTRRRNGEVASFWVLTNPASSFKGLQGNDLSRAIEVIMPLKVMKEVATEDGYSFVVGRFGGFKAGI